MLMIGSKIKNRYKIISLLGDGGMSTVYKAERMADRRRFAIKEVKDGFVDTSEKTQVLNQFKMEARILARLDHPNLPKIEDFFVIRSTPYLVMEYVEGKTLEDILIENQGRLPDELMALNWAVQICRVLYFLNIQSPRPIVFRDLKPGNIMVSPENRVKLIDFGIARFFKKEKKGDTYIFGTPGYAAPEQYGLGQTDARSDIYSLGATMHHCLTGRDPRGTPFEFKPPVIFNKNITKKTSDIIIKAVAYEKEKRYQNAIEMKDDIYKALIEAARPKGAKTRRLDVNETRRFLDLRKVPCGKTRTFELALPYLGCYPYRGSISFDQPWISAEPKEFNEKTVLANIKIDTSQLKSGKIYEPVMMIRSSGGVMQLAAKFKAKRSFLVPIGILFGAGLFALLFYLLRTFFTL